METTTHKIALRPYIEAIREHCGNLSKEELVETIISLAQDVPVRERAEFLDKIRVLAPPRSAAGAVHDGGVAEEALLDRIEALKEDIEDRMRSIDDGTYWDDLPDWEDPGYDEEQPDYVSQEQMDELEGLFLKTGGLFLEGRLETAARLYGALFDIIAEHSEVPACFSGKPTDLREERARYCRSVYEVADPQRRLDDFLQCMDVEASMNPYRLALQSEQMPMLGDVIDAMPGDLPGREAFLPAWEKALSGLSTDRAAVLWMEAVEMLQGVDALSRPARTWKAGQPRGYLFWIQRLEGTGNWKGMLDACREALDELPVSGFREQAAEHLITAAVKTGETELLLVGKRERFLSAPKEASLLDLLGEAERRGVRSVELEAILEKREIIANSRLGDPGLYYRILFMAGRLRDAFIAGKDENNLGWSYGKAGILFASVLSVLTGNSPDAVVIDKLLREYAGGWSDFDDNEENGRTIYHEILKGLSSVELSESRKLEYGEWAERMGRDRIDGIVAGKRRRVYDRAARALGALAEYYGLSGETAKAHAIFNEYLSVKYPRHSAFRSEVKAVAVSSPVLKALRIV